MHHDVYIGYCDENEKAAKAIKGIFDDNNIKSWVKFNRTHSKDNDEKAIDAIESSKCAILIHSGHANEDANFIEDAGIAFSKGIPIILFKLDESKLDDHFEYYVSQPYRINSFANTRNQLEILIRYACAIIESRKMQRKIDDEDISETAGKLDMKVKLRYRHVRAVDATNPYKKEKNIRKYAAIAAAIVIALVLVDLFITMPTGQHTTDDGVFSIDLTGVDVDGLKYTLHGESYNLPSDSHRYFMNINFLDENDNTVFNVNSTADEFRHGIIWKGEISADNVTHIDFRLIDMSGDVLSDEDYVI